MIVLRDFALDLPLTSVLFLQGIDPTTRQISPFLQELNDQAIVECRNLLQPVLAYEVVSIVSRDDAGVTAAGGVRLEGAFFAEHLALAAEIVVGACTVGARVDERIAAHYRDDAARAMALSGASSAAVVEVCTRSCRAITETAITRGLRAGPLLVPGELGCPLQAQRPIFDLLDGGQVAIVLSARGTLSPTYSLNFIVPLGARLEYGEGGRCPLCRYFAFCPVRDT